MRLPTPSWGSRVLVLGRRLGWAAAVVAVLALVLPQVARADRFPPTDSFNGLVITYSVSGAQMEAPVDTGGFTTTREMTGKLTGERLQVSGTVEASNGWSAAVTVTVSAGGESETFTAQSPPAPNGLYEAPWSESFDIGIDVPKGASGSFSVFLSGEYNAGGRGLSVSGTFEGDGSGGGGSSGGGITGGGTSGGTSGGGEDGASGGTSEGDEGSEGDGTKPWRIAGGGLAAAAALAAAIVGVASKAATGEGTKLDPKEPIGYILQVSQRALGISERESVALEATVFKVLPDGSTLPAGEATITAQVPAGVSAQSLSAVSSLRTAVWQTGPVQPGSSVVLTATAPGGGTSATLSVTGAGIAPPGTTHSSGDSGIPGIYGTGTRDDPYRDAAAFKVNPDGTISGYPESSQAPIIYGTGTREDPYSNTPNQPVDAGEPGLPEGPDGEKEPGEPQQPGITTEPKRPDPERPTSPEGVEPPEDPKPGGPAEPAKPEPEKPEPEKPEPEKPTSPTGPEPAPPAGTTEEKGKEKEPPASGDGEDKTDLTKTPGKIAEGLGGIEDHLGKIKGNLDKLEEEIKAGRVPLSEEGKKTFKKMKGKLDGLNETITEKVGAWKETAEGVQGHIDQLTNLRDEVKEALQNIDDFHRQTRDIQMDGRSRGAVSSVLGGAELVGRSLDSALRKTFGDKVADAVGAKKLGKEVSEAGAKTIRDVTSHEAQIQADPELHEMVAGKEAVEKKRAYDEGNRSIDEFKKKQADAAEAHRKHIESMR